jgi:hypothetical protein
MAVASKVVQTGTKDALTILPALSRGWLMRGTFLGHENVVAKRVSDWPRSAGCSACLGEDHRHLDSKRLVERSQCGADKCDRVWDRRTFEHQAEAEQHLGALREERIVRLLRDSLAQSLDDRVVGIDF